MLPALGADRRIVLFDFVGFGLSAKPDVRYAIRRYADQAEEVAEALGLGSVVLVTHDMGDTVGGELLARDLDGDLHFAIERRVLTNGSIYIEMAHLTAGQQLLLALDDARADISGSGDDPGEPFKTGLAGVFSAAHQPSTEELDAQWAFASFRDGHTLLPRTIRYIEDRRAEQDRFTGAIERHPSPLGVVWGELDPVAVAAMTERLVEARPDTKLIRLDDVGHYPMVESPDAFATAYARCSTDQVPCNSRPSITSRLRPNGSARSWSIPTSRPTSICPTCRSPMLSSTTPTARRTSYVCATSTSAISIPSPVACSRGATSRSCRPSSWIRSRGEAH